MKTATFDAFYRLKCLSRQVSLGFKNAHEMMVNSSFRGNPAVYYHEMDLSVSNRDRKKRLHFECKCVEVHRPVAINFLKPRAAESHLSPLCFEHSRSPAASTASSPVL
jgi:hypothetical protein